MTRTLLKTSDFMTMLAAGVEQKLYNGQFNLWACGKFGVIGILARLVEQVIYENALMANYMPADQREAKNQVIVFVFNLIYSAVMEKKSNSMWQALRGVNSDLLGQWAANSLFATDYVIFELPAPAPVAPAAAAGP